MTHADITISLFYYLDAYWLGIKKKQTGIHWAHIIFDRKKKKTKDAKNNNEYKRSMKNK